MSPPMESQWGHSWGNAHSSVLAPQPVAHHPHMQPGKPFGQGPPSPDNCPHPANFSAQELQRQGVNLDNTVIVMDASFPYRIRHASDAWLNLFRFDKPAVIGRSLKLVHGPGTDAAVVNQMMTTAMNGKESEEAITLYTSEGQPAIYCTQSRALYNGPDVAGIALTMKPSDAVPFKVACQELMEPMCIVSATEPHSVDMVNSAFTELFGFSELQVAGRSLRVIQGPKTDMFSWTKMFKGSKTGLSKTGWFNVCGANCNDIDAMVKVQPVFASGGKISHLKVTFQAARNEPVMEPEEKVFHQEQSAISLSSGFEQCFEMPPSQPVPQIKTEDLNQHFRPPQQSFRAPSQQFAPATPSIEVSRPMVPHAQPMDHKMSDAAPAHRPMFHEPVVAQGPFMAEPINIVFEDLSMPSNLPFGSQQQQQQAQAPAQRSAEPEPMFKIFPRRKNGQDAKDSLAGPVCITLEVLEQSADMSLCEFAKRHGISATAVKRACRKLGVQRWPYRKNGEQSQAIVTDGMDVESAAWKMFRKYVAKASRESKKASAKPQGAKPLGASSLGSWQSQGSEASSSLDTEGLSRGASEAISPVNSEDSDEFEAYGEEQQALSTRGQGPGGMEVSLLGMQMQHTSLNALGFSDPAAQHHSAQHSGAHLAASYQNQAGGLTALERLSLEQPFFNHHQNSLDEGFANWANF